MYCLSDPLSIGNGGGRHVRTCWDIKVDYLLRVLSKLEKMRDVLGLQR